MARENTIALTIARIDRAKPKDKGYYFLWDTEQEGLGVKIEASGYKSYVYRYKIDTDKRRVIAGVNEISLEVARDIAQNYAQKVKKNIDPFSIVEEYNLLEVCEQYIELRKTGDDRKKAVAESTYGTWKCHINKHIKHSKLGSMPISMQLATLIKEFNDFMNTLSEVKVHANRIRTFLLLVLNYANMRGYRCDERDIKDIVPTYIEDPKRPRIDNDNDVFCQYLKDAESGAALDRRGGFINRYWVHFIWLLYFTGARPNELKTAKWEDVDFEKRVLKVFSKTGFKEIHLSEPALERLNKVNRIEANPYIFPVGRDSHMQNYRQQWLLMKERIGTAATPYSLRRYFMTTGKEEEGGVKLTSKVVGHKTEAMTEMYAGTPEKAEEKQRKIISKASEKIGKALKKKAKLT